MRQYGLGWKIAHFFLQLKKQFISAFHVNWEVFAHEEMQSWLEQNELIPRLLGIIPGLLS